MEQNIQPEYQKLLDPIEDITISVEALLNDVFGTLMGDQREDLKRIHAYASDLYTLLAEIITSLGIENVARWAYLEEKFDQILTPLLENSQVLYDGLDGPLEPEQVLSVQHILETGHLLRNNVDKLWMYSRIVNNRFELQNTLIDLHEIQEALSLPKNKASVQLSMSIPAGLPKIRGDFRAVRFALEELIANAIRFTERGMIHVLVQHTRSHIIIRVKDNGGGINSVHQKRIFNPFFQGSKFGMGVGLGLSITRELIERHGGRVWLQHSSDTGSIFAIQIPSAHHYFSG